MKKQFSITSMLVVTVIVGVALAWWLKPPVEILQSRLVSTELPDGAGLDLLSITYDSLKSPTLVEYSLNNGTWNEVAVLEGQRFGECNIVGWVSSTTGSVARRFVLFHRESGDVLIELDLPELTGLGETYSSVASNSAAGNVFWKKTVRFPDGRIEEIRFRLAKRR